MGVKLQLLLGLLLLSSTCGSENNFTSAEDISSEKVDSSKNVIEKLPKTDTQVNLVRKDTQDGTDDSPKYSKYPIENDTHKNQTVSQEESISNENDRKGRQENSRAIDIDKFSSADFHNNDYSSSDNQKFSDNSIRKTSPKGFADFNTFQLTTPKTAYLDTKYEEARQKLEQEYEENNPENSDDHHIDGTREVDENEHEHIDHDLHMDRFFENLRHNPNSSLDYKEKTKISRNNTFDDNSEHNELTVVKVQKLNFASEYNFTTSDEDDSGKVDSFRETTSPRTFLTTRKTVTLTKPPTTHNNHILSNKIESETIKAINFATTEYSTTKRLKDENEVVPKEQIFEENKIKLVEVNHPDTITTQRTLNVNNDTTTTEQINGTTDKPEQELSLNRETTATTTDQYEQTTVNNQVTPGAETTIRSQVKYQEPTVQMSQETSELFKDTTTNNIAETTYSIDDTTYSIGETTLSIGETTHSIGETTNTVDETTLGIDAVANIKESTTESVADNHPVGVTTNKIEVTTLETTSPETTTELTNTSLESTSTILPKDQTTIVAPSKEIGTIITSTIETTTNIEDITTEKQEGSEATTTERGSRVSKSFVFNDTTTPEHTESTTVEPDLTTTSVNVEHTDTTENYVKVKSVYVTTTTLKSITDLPETSSTISKLVSTVSTSGTTTTSTTSSPTHSTTRNTSPPTPSSSTSSYIPTPKLHSIPVTTSPLVTSSTEDYTSDSSPVPDAGGRDDNTGKIAAIVISTVGAISLILLAGLLYIMRKRQKRFNYKQRCRPVSLDHYNVDNVSNFNSQRRKAERQSKRSYGNPAFDDPTGVTHPLNFPALAKFATNAEDIKAEFNEIPQITAKISELPDGCEIKNRYANVIPLPESRVYLQPIDGYPTSDYINANYVTGPKNTKGYYIACQAPLQNTVDDFWRMIWEQQSKVILMITHLFENGVEKCVDYLPPSEVLDCNRLFGDFQVTLKKRDVKDKYIISNLQLKNMVSNSWREVTHFWYLGWPEKGVPSEENSLIAFLIEARSYMKSSTLDKTAAANGNTNGPPKNEVNPVVVHCSPGTGRTGVVIACDIAIREFEQTRLIDIPKIVYRIRRDRASAVQTKEQYMFIYKVASLYATKLTGGALESF